MTSREPQTVVEHVTANTRPQPAIPAVLVTFLFVLLPALSAQGGIETWQLWLVPAGVIASAGLAIAAGFCSFAPHGIWLLLAAWAHNLLTQTEFPGWVFVMLYLCSAATAAMFFVQLWRVRTRRFIPTIREREWSEDED